tara:strand:+ start:1315 stop:1848 length:534 start_codon:yes stop_codon:yes gene_type:complete
MSIRVKVENNVDAILELRATKTLDGNIFISEHPEIDIIVSLKNNKVLAMPKEQYGDKIYETESRLFDFLKKKGVVDPSSIHSGNIFGSLEAVILESANPEETNSIQATMYTIVKFLLEEKPHYQAAKQYEIDFEKSLLEPDADDSTELGEVPHETRKGPLTQFSGLNAAYGQWGVYE